VGEGNPAGKWQGGTMIRLNAINHSYGDHQVLHDVTFDVKPGMMTGFVGANGAGKTTAMRIVLGVLEPDSGVVEVDGAPITREYRSRIGYMPEERGLYPKMKVIDQLVYLGQLRGLTATKARERGNAILERLGLAERAQDAVEELSLGNQQRAQIAAALVHDPIALVLDEPFSGLDPVAVETTLDVLRDVARTGAPVLFSSHQLDVVERLCDEIVIISNGKVAAHGSREELLNSVAEPEWEITTTTDTGWVRDLDVEVVEFETGYARFRAENAEVAGAVLKEAQNRGTVERFGPVQHTLHEIFKESLV